MPGVGTTKRDTDFPNFQLDSTFNNHSASSVIGNTITGKVYMPIWVGEIAKPFASLWSGNQRLGYVDDDCGSVSWVGTPTRDVWNSFQMTIPSTCNNGNVTSVTLNQDAQGDYDGFGQTKVYWYFE